MKRVILLLGVALFLAGCAATKQAISDYQTGQSTPLAANEVSPAQQAQVIQNTVAALPVPFAMPVSLAIGFLGTAFFTWQRGKQIRKNGGAPIASSGQDVHGWIQDIANIFTGMFTTAQNTAANTPGSAFQRVWKVALATIASGASIAVVQPQFGAFLGAHPYLSAGFVAISSGLAGLEKALSNVPVPPAL